MPKPIQTDRLYLRPIAQSDYPLLRALHSDPDVMKYIADGGTRSEAQTNESLRKSLEVEKENPKLGVWITELKDSRLAIGNIIIRKPATPGETPGLEIGFSFLKEYWGKGYATEASKRVIEYIYQEFGRINVVGLIEPSNDASRKTLTKLGFSSVGMDDYVDPLTGRHLPTEVLVLAPN